MNPQILTYHQTFSEEEKNICEKLASLLSTHLPEAEHKIWHGHPVWFLDGNPVAGYSKRKRGICLMFWSGQSFDEPALEKEGRFKAAQIFFNHPQEVPEQDLQRWIQKSADIQWDYQNIVKRRGQLLPLKGLDGVAGVAE